MAFDPDDTSLLAQHGGPPRPGALPGEAYPGAAPQNRTSGLAIASLVLGILGFLTACFLVGLPLGLVGLVLGVIALMKIGKPGQPDQGTGMAIAGVVLSALTVLSTLLLTLVFLMPVVGAAVAAVQEFESVGHATGLAEAIEAASDEAGERVIDPGDLLASGHLPDASVFLSPGAAVNELPADFDSLSVDEKEAFLRENASLIPVPAGGPPAPDAIVVFSVPGLWPDPFGGAGRFTVARLDGSTTQQVLDTQVREELERQTGRTPEQLVDAFRSGEDGSAPGSPFDAAD